MVRSMMRFLPFLLLTIAIPAFAQLYDSEPFSPELDIPVRFAFAPDGTNRVFYCELLTGHVKVFGGDSTQNGTWLTLESSTLLKQGLLGMVLDPDFAQNHYVYLFYTLTADTPANVVERYTEVNFRADTSSRLVLFEQSIQTPCGSGTTHNGSGMAFGAERKLYITLGDNGCPILASDSTDPRGTVLRIEPDRPGPMNAVMNNPWYDDGNPFTGADDRIFAKAFRNPFGITLSPFDSLMYVTENGPDCNDQIDRIVAGGDYGWRPECDSGLNHCQCPQEAPIITPLLSISPPVAPTGLTFYSGSLYPELDGQMIFLDDVHGAVHAASFVGPDSVSDRIISQPGLGGLFDIHVGPDGYIYFSHFGGIRRLLPRPTAAGEARPPLHAHLLQNYPNPFNPSTVISYALERPAPVHLRVFSLLGREVALLVDERQTPGRHEVRFDASALAAGVYFYQLSVPGTVLTRKLVVLR
jgi:glucose/arabinose dehydrogenase